jgi:hypothetical protein
MQEFIEIPASKKSKSFRKLVHGVGINDANYMVCPKVNGKNSFCPYYKVWMNMISRAYNPKYHKIRPTYSNCTVTPEWLRFSIFKEWMIDKDWNGKHLDKDLLSPGNKIYGPEFCIFVTAKVNSLLTDHGSARGAYPQGVFLDSESGKYRARCSVNGKQSCLGRFEFSFQAELAYLEFKSNLVESIARTEGGLVGSGLLRHAKIMKDRIEDIKQEYTYQG